VEELMDELPAEQQTWHTVAPVYTKFFDEAAVSITGVELGHQVRLQPKPTWFEEDGLPPWIGYFQKRRLVEQGWLAFVVERRVGSKGPTEEQQREDKRKIQLAQIALWLTSGIRLDYDHVFLVEPPGNFLPKPSVRQCKSWQSLLTVAHPDQVRELQLESEHVDRAKALLDVLLKLSQDDGVLWIALRMASFVADERQGDIALTLCWVALEALFSPNDPGETSYQTSLRLALFLEPDRDKARALYRRVKESYTMRSKVVHGRMSGLVKKETDTEKAEALFWETVGWFRESTCRIALSETDREVFKSKGRDDYLLELPFKSSAGGGV